MAFVIKINHEGSLRRLTFPKSPTGAPAITFPALVSRIHESFGIPDSSKLVITYSDNDGDVVIMDSDEELEDACVLQGINPLRLDVRLEAPAAPAPRTGGSTSSGSNGSEGTFADDFKPLVDDFKPLVDAALKAFDSETLKEALEPILKSGLSPKVVADFVQGLGRPPAEAPPATSSDKAVAPQAPSAEPAPAGTGEAPPGVHHGVQCDVCDISPIVGPRFKSTTKHDYDLCFTCFDKLPKGSQAEYTRHDFPVNRFRHYVPPMGRGRCPAFGPPFSGFYGRYRPGWGGRHGDHHRLQHENDFASRYAPFSRPMDMLFGKPDGRFVCDVTIPDGTEVSPHTRFVKIWRLRNSGKVTWAPDTRLLRVGGDEMGTVSAVSLQTESGGVPPDGELEVAVDLVAPARPGRYVSYWRLVTPSGLKFGHRVWALIQVTATPEPGVDVKVEKPADEAIPSPRENVVEVGDAVSAASTDEVVLAPSAPLDESVSSDKAGDVGDEYDIEADEVEEGFTVVGKGRELVPPPEMEEVRPPRVDEAPPVVVASEKSPADTAAGSSLSEREKTAAFIQSMGFTNKRELILQLLEKNDNDFNRTLDDLVAAAEWDPILEDLREMGFYDTEMNRKLMIKNNGSVKRVVKELVHMYKDPAPKPATEKNDKKD